MSTAAQNGNLCDLIGLWAWSDVYRLFTGRVAPPILIVMKKLKRLIAFLCLLFFCCGQPETEVIALVGDERITAAELRDFAERREKGTAISDTSDPLQQLIARRLLLLEARKVGMAADSVFVRRLERQRRDAVIESYLERQIDAKNRRDSRRYSAGIL